MDEQINQVLGGHGGRDKSSDDSYVLLLSTELKLSICERCDGIS